MAAICGSALRRAVPRFSGASLAAAARAAFLSTSFLRSASAALFRSLAASFAAARSAYRGGCILYSITASFYTITPSVDIRRQPGCGSFPANSHTEAQILHLGLHAFFSAATAFPSAFFSLAAAVLAAFLALTAAVPASYSVCEAACSRPAEWTLSFVK